VKHIRQLGRPWLPLLVIALLVPLGCSPVASTSSPSESSSKKTETPKKGSTSKTPEEGSTSKTPEEGTTPETPEPPEEGTTPETPEPPEEGTTPETPEPPEETPTTLGDMVEIDLDLPAPAFRGTPVPLNEPNVAKPRGKPRGPFLAPKGTINLSRGKPVTCSDPAPAAGEVDFVTDGDKEASDFGYLELRPGTEWVQIDLGQKSTIYAVFLWHNHAEARVYRDVIVEISDDPDFLESETVFNNDYDGSSGMGIGPDMGYVETSEGKLVDGRGFQGRYVRLSSRGNNVDVKNDDDKNHYTEVEIYGKPGT